MRLVFSHRICQGVLWVNEFSEYMKTNATLVIKKIVLYFSNTRNLCEILIRGGMANLAIILKASIVSMAILI